MNEYTAVDLQPRQPEELFIYDGESRRFSLLDFWIWSGSNVLNNTLYQSYELTLYSRPFSRTQFFDRIVACCIGIPRLTACLNNSIISLKTPIG